MIRVENFDNVIVRTPNINCISTKFDEFKLMASGLLDIIIVTEIQLYESFQEAQFCKNGFSIPYRLGRNRNSGWLMIYVSDDIARKMLKKHNLSEDTEAAFRKCKWLLCATYRPPSKNPKYFFDNIDKGLDVYSAYRRVALARDVTT